MTAFSQARFLSVWVMDLLRRLSFVRGVEDAELTAGRTQTE